jgi:hypothetical protein
MDLQEQRITCLQMAVDMGCKADTVFGLASELMGFVTSGVAPSTFGPSPEEVAEHGIAATATVEPTAAGSAPLPLTEACETTQAAMEILSAPAPESAPSLVDAMVSAATQTVASASAETTELPATVARAAEVPGSSSLTVEVAPMDVATTAPEAGRPTFESPASETAVQSSDAESRLEMTSGAAATVSSALTTEATQAQFDASAAKSEDASGESAEGSTSAAPAEATVKTNGAGKSDVEIGAPTAT